MASAAFKSTTRRSFCDASSTDRSDQPRRSLSRSRSVSAAPRGRGVEEDYANTRTNPLFDSKASPSTSSSPPPAAATSSGPAGGDAARRGRDRGREPVKDGGRGGGGRARSVSVAPQGRHTGSTSSADTAAAVGGRRSSRARSVTDGARPYRGSETDAESGDTARKLQSQRTPDSVVEDKHRGNRIHASFSSQEAATEVLAIFRQNNSVTTVDPFLEIPPEFDPDSAEFIFDTSDYATEYRNEDVAEISLDSDTDTVELALDTGTIQQIGIGEPIEIPLEFDRDAAEPVSDMKHHDAKQQWVQRGIPLEFDPDTSDLAPDITEYTIKLKQSHERARKLRADLAVEQQREQELSRMLKDIVTDPKFSETHRKRPRRKSSIERMKVSRHLAEEAMNYFEECVSISTMDSTDFSSPDDPQLNSIVSAPAKNNSRFFCKGRSSFQETHTTDQHDLLEESDNQTQCSISRMGSDMSDNVALSHINAPRLQIRSNPSDDFDGFDTPRSRSSCFSFTHRVPKTIESCVVQQYLGCFGRGDSKNLKDMKSSYCADDYAFQKANLDLLKDTVTFRSRIEYGGLRICNTRTF